MFYWAEGFTFDSNGLLLYNGGFVCDDDMNNNVAILICMEMGFVGALSWSGFQQNGSNEFGMDSIYCSGATDWSQCTFKTTDDCSNGEGVQLVCTYDANHPQLNFIGTFSQECAPFCQFLS